ncbi:Zinc finger CCCH domain-containing protein [Drosera capensis]
MRWSCMSRAMRIRVSLLLSSPSTLENLIGVSSDGALYYFHLRFSMVYENRNYIKTYILFLWMTRTRVHYQLCYIHVVLNGVSANSGVSPTGCCPPRSEVRMSDRKFGKRQHDGQSDFSSSLRASDGTDDRGKEEKLASSRSKDLLRDHVLRIFIKEMKLDVDLLNDNKQQLEVELKERSQEVDSLSYRIQELESQLSEEKEIFRS